MSTPAERTVLHVLPHPGGGGETYVDLLEGMPGYSFERLHLASSADANVPAVARRLPAVARAARRHDLLHVHGEVAAALCVPLLASRRSVVTLHGLHLVRRTTGARGTAARLSLRAVLRAADRTICVSVSEHDELIRAVGAGAARQAVVVRNGVDVDGHAASAEDRVAVRASLRVSPSETVAIWVGSLDERKDPLAALRAAEEVPVTLLVVGDGPLRAEVERASSERVRVLGPRDDVGRLLSASDIFVLTSSREGLSFSLLEAMAYGLAPVVTELPENMEAIGHAGVAVGIGDYRSLSGALRRLAEDSSERGRLGEEARRRIATLFSASQMERATRTVYDEVLADRHPWTRPLPTAQ